VLLIQGALGRALAEGGSDSPDGTARPVTINFDTVPTNVPLPANQYQIASFTSYAGGTVYTQYDAGLGGSYPNGIIATSGSGSNYWPTADVYVNFAIPVNGLSFRVLGSQAGGSSGYVDVYVNYSYSQRVYFSSGTGGGPGQIYPAFVVNLGGIQHVTGISIRNVLNYDYWYYSNYLLYYDDFNFTPELSANITNSRIGGGQQGLDQTTQSALAGAKISLTSTTSQTGGTYLWTFTPSSYPYSIISGCQSTSSSCTIRPTGTAPAIITATLKYTLNSISVSPSVNINVVIPTLSNFSGSEEGDQLLRDAFCGGYSFGVTYSLGCYQPGGTERGILWNATAQISAVTYLSDPAESGIKFIQAIDSFRRRVEEGNIQCYTVRPYDYQSGSGWQLDTQDPYNHTAHPPRYFSEGNALVMGDFDSPAAQIERDYVDFYSEDARLIDEKFEVYVFYFTTDPANRDPEHPIFQRAIGLQGSSYPYARLAWSWGGQVLFNYYSSPHFLTYTLDSYTLVGTESATATSEIKPLATNVANLTWHTCSGSTQTSNPIDGSRFYVGQLYSDFLRHNPDEDGWNFWRSNITQCGFDISCIGGRDLPGGKRVDVARAFLYSTEFVGLHPELGGPRGTHDYNVGFVFGCYRGFLQREPNGPPDNNWDGFNLWVNKLDSTNPDAGDAKYNEMIKAFINSIEYRARF